MAPEMIHPSGGGGRVEYGYKVDMYAFGILLLELSLRVPEGSRWIECVPPSVDGGSASLNAAVELVDNHEARHLIAQLIHRDPSKRPSSASFLISGPAIFPTSRDCMFRRHKFCKIGAGQQPALATSH
ncbi:hypothetical protein CONPUDRAFT_162845, partial [Coniophora puteana RWD-64-598 SS2]